MPNLYLLPPDLQNHLKNLTAQILNLYEAVCSEQVPSQLSLSVTIRMIPQFIEELYSKQVIPEALFTNILNIFLKYLSLLQPNLSTAEKAKVEASISQEIPKTINALKTIQPENKNYA